MKKFNVKSGLCGFIVGVTAMCTVPAVAKDIQTTISVAYKNIKIYADGNLVNTSDSNEAFIYNGTTYLPVRAVGEAFNKAVNWDGKNSAVYIGTQPANMSQPTVLLEDLDYFTSTMHFLDMQDGGKDNLGNIHSSGVRCDGDAGEIIYVLDGKYKTFSGVVGLSYSGRDTNREYGLKVYGDGKLLYSSPNFTGGVKPEKFNFDITGVLELKIERIGYDHLTFSSPLHIYDAGFYA